MPDFNSFIEGTPVLACLVIIFCVWWLIRHRDKGGSP